MPIGGEAVSAWLTRHLQTSIGSLGRLAQHKLATMLTMLVIGIALALPACLHLLVTNAQTATGNWNRAVDLTVFLKRPTSAEEARRDGGAHPAAPRRGAKRS